MAPKAFLTVLEKSDNSSRRSKLSKIKLKNRVPAIIELMYQTLARSKWPLRKLKMRDNRKVSKKKNS